MRRSTTLLLFSLALTAPGLRAQTTWIVDRNAGPDHDFTTIGAAVAVAAAGDTILVRGGDYSESALVIDRGIALLGAGNVALRLSTFGTPGVEIRDIPAGQTVTIRGIDLGGSLASPDLLATNCTGPVHIADVTGPQDPSLGIPEPLSVQCADCAQVDLRGLFVRESSVRIERSSGSIRLSALEGATFGPLQIEDSDFLVDRCTISIGVGLPFVFGSPVFIDGGRVRIARSSVTASMTMGAAAAIEASGNPDIDLDPTTTLNPGPGQPPISGTATVRNRELTSFGLDFGTGETTFRLHGPTGAPFSVLLSLPAAAIPLPPGLFEGAGEFWIDFPTHFVATSDVLTGRIAAETFDTSGVPAGFTVVAQAVALDGTTLSISNGLVVVFDGT